MPQDTEAPASKSQHTSSKKEGWRSIASTVAILLTAPLIAIFLTAFVFQSYQVDGASMETTLSHNDRLLVWKLSKTWSKLTGHAYVPDRGDIVVFTEPALGQFGQDPGKQLIKRVVGLPGEKVVVKDGKLIVYNQNKPDGFEPDKELAYGAEIPNTPIEGEWQIGDNELFVVGDNRSNSLDSRTFGPINTNNVVGKLSARVLPLDEIEKF
jgi:signal peptidase I